MAGKSLSKSFNPYNVKKDGHKLILTLKDQKIIPLTPLSLTRPVA